MITARTKHLGAKTNFLKENVELGVIKMIYCPTDKKNADICTKALAPNKFNYFKAQMNLREGGVLERVTKFT